MRAPTKRQLEVMGVIADYWDAHHMAPTWRDVGAPLGIRSTNGVHDHLLFLERKGLVVWERGKARTVRLTSEGYRLLGREKPLSKEDGSRTVTVKVYSTVRRLLTREQTG